MVMTTSLQSRALRRNGRPPYIRPLRLTRRAALADDRRMSIPAAPGTSHQHAPTIFEVCMMILGALACLVLVVLSIVWSVLKWVARLAVQVRAAHR